MARTGAALVAALLVALLGESAAREDAVQCRGSIEVVRLAQEGGAQVEGEMTLMQVVRGKRPMIVEGTVAERWAAKGKWGPEFVKEELGDVAVEWRSSDRRVFTIRSKNPDGPTLRGKLDAEKDRVVTYHNGTLRDVVDAPNYAYFSGPLTFSDALEEQVADYHELEVLEAGMGEEAVANRIMHFGKAGVTAQLHYDKSRNFLAQVYGSKRVIMYHPDMHWTLNPFPVLHPSRRQSQLDIFSGEFPPWVPADKMKDCVEGMLKPGQALYIPPFWWHQIEYQDFAVSLSVVSPSIPEFLFSRIKFRPLKFLEHGATAPELLPTAIRMYLERAVPNLPALAGKLATSRYDPIGDEILEASEPEPACPEIQDSWRQTMSQLMDEHIQFIQVLLTKQLIPNNFRLETDIQFADMIEEYARFAVGVQNVHGFIKSLAAAP